MVRRAILNEIDWRILRPLRQFISWTDRYFAEPSDGEALYAAGSLAVPARLSVVKARPAAWKRVEIAARAGRGWCGPASLPLEMQAARHVA